MGRALSRPLSDADRSVTSGKRRLGGDDSSVLAVRWVTAIAKRKSTASAAHLTPAILAGLRMSPAQATRTASDFSDSYEFATHKSASSGVERIGIPADFVDRPAGRRRRAPRVVLGAILSDDLRAPDHVVEDEPATDGLTRVLGIEHVVDLSELKGLDIPVGGVSHPCGFDLTPPVGGVTVDGDFWQHRDQVRLADGPAAVTEVTSRRSVGRIASRGTVVRPGCDHGNLGIAERRIVLVVLNPDVPLDVPRRHHPRTWPHGGPTLHRPSPGSCLLVRQE